MKVFKKFIIDEKKSKLNNSIVDVWPYVRGWFVCLGMLLCQNLGTSRCNNKAIPNIHMCCHEFFFRYFLLFKYMNYSKLKIKLDTKLRNNIFVSLVILFLFYFLMMRLICFFFVYNKLSSNFHYI